MSLALTTGQQVFVQRFSKDTGLDPAVVAAWVYNEENGSYAQQRQAQSNHNWLNIGYTDSGQMGTGNSFWRNPITAADASAQWLQGRLSVPGFGSASAGVRAIASTAGQSPEAQVRAIQNSGWASSHYPNLPSIYLQAKGFRPGSGAGGLLSSIGGGLTSFGGGVGSAAGDVNAGLRHIPGVAQAEGVVGGVASVGEFLGRLTDPHYILRGLQIVAGGVLVLVGVVLLARQVGLAFAQSDTGQAVTGAAESVVGRGVVRGSTPRRRRGNAAITRGEEVTRTSSPERRSTGDKVRAARNARARSVSAQRERRARDERYGEIPF